MLLALNQEFSLGPSPAGYYTEGGVFYVKCKLGYTWTDGFSVKLIKCLSTNWTDVPVICQGTTLEFENCTKMTILLGIVQI